ncbi:MAG: AmmeMemoRadiSam system protein B [Balneolaceae bacterium]
MNITSLSREAIQKGLSDAKARQKTDTNTIRILFSPTEINQKNFDEVCDSYSRISSDDFDSVVVIESQFGSHKRKLPMPSMKYFETSLGAVPVNDKLRNELCDEDDDFFIDDEAYSENLSLYSQLMMLQCTLDNFSVLSLQITDETSFIVKELAHALEEILASRNTLIVFCCDLNHADKDEIEKVMGYFSEKNISGLMNYLNSDESSITGLGSFITGLLIAEKWGMKLHLNHKRAINNGEDVLYSGFAEIQRQAIIG